VIAIPGADKPGALADADKTEVPPKPVGPTKGKGPIAKAKSEWLPVSNPSTRINDSQHAPKTTAEQTEAGRRTERRQETLTLSIQQPAHWFGIVGAILLLLGVFMPAVSAPLFGSLNYFHFSEGTAVVLIVVAVASVVLSVVRVYRGVWASGILILALVSYSFIRLQFALSDMRSAAVAEAQKNPFGGIAEAFAINVQPEWGWAILLLGVILVLASGVLAELGRLRKAGTLFPRAIFLIIGLAMLPVALLFAGVTAWAANRIALKDREVAKKENGSGFPWRFRDADAVLKEYAEAKANWKRKYNVSEKQWNEMIGSYKVRKRPAIVTETDWWDEAKDKTPAGMNQLYPPLQPRDWYQAEWPSGSFSHSRELDFDFGDRQRHLKVRVWISTEPDVPIKELHGHLVIVKGKEVIYETELAEKPDVSFTDKCFVHLSVPYDDNNSKLRTLRFAKDDELRPVFTVKKVVLADGTVTTFD
jgi:hypothetical protein